MSLPVKHEPYIDKYFLRSKEILRKEGINPVITAQVFIRKGDVKVYGIREALDILERYGHHGNLSVHALPEGEHFDSCEPLMIIKGNVQEIIDLETMYLGVISAETTLRNDNKDIDLRQIRENMSKVVEIAGDRPVSYFGARHWRYDRDGDIAEACYNGGAVNCSTDEGGMRMGGQQGIGTIPHALEAIYHDRYGIHNAVTEATISFDAHMDDDIPRVALIDYANREIQDTIKTASVLEDLGNKKLDAIRIDTCGENVIQSAMHIHDKSYWFGKGVSISGVHNIRKALDYEGFDYVKIMLSSGFGNPEKVKEFVDAEKILKTRLFDGLGVGGVFYSRMATMDIVAVGSKPISKVGRSHNKSKRLKRFI